MFPFQKLVDNAKILPNACSIKTAASRMKAATMM